MMNYKWQSLVAGCAVLVALLFIVAEVEARRGGGGRGGGRGGGGKSFSRSGPASSGSVRSQRPTSSQRGSNRGSMQDNRGANRGDQRSNMQDNRSDRRGDMQDNRNDRLDNVQDTRKERREDWQDYGDDVRDDRRDWYDDQYRRRVGVSLTYTTFRSLSCTTTTVYVGSVTYYRCGSDWYSRAYHGGNVTYVVVTAPAGH